MKLEDLSPELVEKAHACATPEELLSFVKEEGIELTDEQMDEISGGFFVPVFCPKCRSTSIYCPDFFMRGKCTCRDCGHTWNN